MTERAMSPQSGESIKLTINTGNRFLKNAGHPLVSKLTCSISAFIFIGMFCSNGFHVCMLTAFVGDVGKEICQHLSPKMVICTV